jgi:Protein of unknown function (DUF3568)
LTVLVVQVGALAGADVNVSSSMKLTSILFLLTLSACSPLAMTFASIGGGAAAQHQIGGYAHRTFSEPLPKVRGATLIALKRMSMKAGTAEKLDQGERILAKAGDRNIEIEIEVLTPRTTRLTAVAKREGSFFVDAATATEVVAQVEKAMRVTQVTQVTVTPHDDRPKELTRAQASNGKIQAVALQGY